MKAGQLVEHNLRNFEMSLSLEKSYKKCIEETIPRPFSKNQNWAYLWINILKFFFLLFGKLRTFESDWNYAADHLLLLHIKLFQKVKRGLDLVFFPHFLHDFWRKYFCCYILLPGQISMFVWLYFVIYSAICVFQLFVNQVVTS